MFIEYRGKQPRVAASAFVAPTAVLIGDVVVGEEASIWFGVVIRADAGTIRIGAKTAIEDNAVIHASGGHNVTVGRGVTIGHGAVLDDCTVGDDVLVGTNAVVLHGASIGESTLVAAGSVVGVGETVPARVVLAGAPATIRKTLSGRAADRIARGTAAATTEARDYRHDDLGDPAQHEFKTIQRRRHGTGVIG